MADPVLPFLRRDVAQLPLYTPVKPLDVLAEEIGVPIHALVKLDANENLYGPLPAVRKAMAEAADMHIYPDPAQTKLRQALAEYCGVTPDRVVAGVGSDELLDLLLRLVVTPNDPEATMLTCSPTFGMYDFLGKLAGAKVVDVARGPAPEFPLDVAELVLKIRACKSTCILFLASPNNPTGGLLSAQDAETLCKERVLLVVDEAYAEFAGQSCIGLLDKYPNLVILRTFSKWVRWQLSRQAGRQARRVDRRADDFAGGAGGIGRHARGVCRGPRPARVSLAGIQAAVQLVRHDRGRGHGGAGAPRPGEARAHYSHREGAAAHGAGAAGV
jgi:histidinol-phosphate aminotransferase